MYRNLEGRTLERKHRVKDLGVLFDYKLTFRLHYLHIVKRTRRLLGLIIISTEDFENKQSVLTLFSSLIRSGLEYCCPILLSSCYKVYKDA